MLGSLLLVLPAPLAGAGPTSSTSSQIQALQGQVVAAGGQIHVLTERYQRAEVEALTLDQQLANERRALGGLRHELQVSHTALTTAAIDSYVGAGGGYPGGTLASAGSTTPEVGMEYLDIATGDVSGNIDLFELRERRVAATEDAIRSALSANATALAAAATARSAALTLASGLQSQIASLQADLVAEQRSARSRAASSTQGGPVGSGLTRVVASQTGGHAPPATPPTTTSPTTVPPTTAPPTTTSPGTAPPTTTPPTTTPPTTAGGSGGGGAGGVWLELRECESSDNYQENTGNGFYGAYQFSESTWSGLGYPGYPYQEPPAMQDAAAMRLQAASGWGQWPACAAELGLT